MKLNLTITKDKNMKNEVSGGDVPSREKEVTKQIHILDSTLAELGDAIEELQKQLVRVLHEEVVANKDAEQKDTNLVPVAYDIHKQNERARNYISVIESITSRLEI